MGTAVSGHIQGFLYSLRRSGHRRDVEAGAKHSVVLIACISLPSLGTVSMIVLVQHWNCFKGNVGGGEVLLNVLRCQLTY